MHGHRMRWSQVLCVCTILLGVAIHEVLALPINSPNYRSLSNWPAVERRSPVINKSSGKIKASSLKSSGYRDRAIKSGKVFDANKKQVIQTKMDTIKAKGMHADHVMEAQTVAKVLDQHGIKPGPQQMSKIKDVVNSPDNLAMVGAKQNMEKGAFSRGALRGKIPALARATKNYMKATSARAMATAKRLDKIVRGMAKKKIFSKAQADINKKAGLRRRSVY